MKTGAVTLLSSSHTRCGWRRSEKGGSHEEDTPGAGRRTSGDEGPAAPGPRDRGEYGDRRVALEASVLRAVGGHRATAAQYPGGVAPFAGGGRAVSGLS